MSYRARRLIDAILIKGRLVDETFAPIPGELRVYGIPGHYSAGKLFRVGADGYYKVPIVGYKPWKKITIVASSPGFIDLTTEYHPKSWINRKGMFAFGAFDGGYKVFDYGDTTMIKLERDFIWYTQIMSGPV